MKTSDLDKKQHIQTISGKDATKYLALDSKVARDAHADFVD
jgi:hypothetical protein